MEDINLQEFLPYAFRHFNLVLEKTEGNHFYLSSGHEVEIENQSLFRLSYQGSVISPFTDVEEMCAFIVQDIALNS